MSNKSNDEKLRILQERLAQIKQKQDTKVPPKQQKEGLNEATYPEIESPKKESKPNPIGWLKYAIIIGIVGYGAFYTYTNLGLSSSKEVDKNIVKKEDAIEYKLNLKGNNIAIIATFKEKNSAKAMVNNLKVKGFRCEYFFLPNQSNGTAEVFNVFIGPYENEEETQQWIDNLDVENEIPIIHIPTGAIKKKTRSKLAIIKEQKEAEKRRKREEKEKLAKEKEEKIKKEKLQKENARKAKEIALKKEKEKKRLAEEKLRREKEEKDKIEKEKLAKEIAEKEILNIDKEKLEREIEELKRNKKELIIEKNSEIKINYTFEFTNTIENEGYLVISNNAGYPKIQQNFTNIYSQGGEENLIKKAKEELDNFGVTLNNIYFEKTNSLTLYYPGDITLVYW